MTPIRASADIHVDCCAPEGLMGNNPDPVVMSNCTDLLPIPCEGSGNIGTWCDNCSFAEIEVDES